jgi:hypothetical protein
VPIQIFWRKPEFGFSAWGVDMNMHAWFFSQKKKNLYLRYWKIVGLTSVLYFGFLLAKNKATWT